MWNPSWNNGPKVSSLDKCHLTNIAVYLIYIWFFSGSGKTTLIATISQRMKGEPD